MAWGSFIQGCVSVCMLLRMLVYWMCVFWMDTCWWSAHLFIAFQQIIGLDCEFMITLHNIHIVYNFLHCSSIWPFVYVEVILWLDCFSSNQCVVVLHSRICLPSPNDILVLTEMRLYHMKHMAAMRFDFNMTVMRWNEVNKCIAW